MKKNPSKQIAVLGAGSWGTAVALALAQQGHDVLLWARDTSYLNNQENSRYLPGIPFPKNLKVCADLSQALTQNYILIAVPSHAVLEIIDAIKVYPKTGIAWLSKGIEPQSYRLFSDILEERFGKEAKLAMISGPSFAKEVAQNKPTALVVAGNCADICLQWQAMLHSNYTRVYTSDDLIGVQICGAVKNVLAIACGVSDGLNYGANARAALITRGLAEMTKLGLAMGAKPESFQGLAGLGDLVLTCTDNQSRNRRFGLYLGQGKSLKEAELEVQQVVEGKYNAQQVMDLATQKSIDLPICQAVAMLIAGELTAQQAALSLLSRPKPSLSC